MSRAFRPPGPSLDLHGVRHGDVEDTVENFVLLHQDETPLEIVYGNSVPMRKLVVGTLDRLGLAHDSGWQNPFGRLVVTGWRE